MPTEYFVKTFGDYEYGDNLATISESVSVRTRVSTPANKQGRFTAGGLRDSISLTLSGQVVADDPEDPQSIVDKWTAFKSAHRASLPKKLYVNSNRYLMAEVTSDVRAEDSKGLSFRNYSVTMTAYDPMWYSDSLTTVTLAHDGSDEDLTVVGDSETYPVLSLTVSAIGDGGLVTITDSYGDELSFVSPDATGTYLIDSEAEKVTGPSGALANRLVYGVFPVLLFPTAGTISVVVTGAMSLSAASLAYRGRWS